MALPPKRRTPPNQKSPAAAAAPCPWQRHEVAGGLLRLLQFLAFFYQVWPIGSGPRSFLAWILGSPKHFYDDVSLDAIVGPA